MKVISWNYEDLDYIPLALCYIKVIIFHLGTIIFGSLITSIFKVLIVVLEFLSSRTKKL